MQWLTDELWGRGSLLRALNNVFHGCPMRKRPFFIVLSFGLSLGLWCRRVDCFCGHTDNIIVTVSILTVSCVREKAISGYN